MSPVPQQDAPYAAKRPVFNLHFVSDFQEGPGLSGQSRLNSDLNRSNFAFLNCHWNFADSHHVNNPRYADDWQSIGGIKLAKHIPWKKRQFYFLEAIGPTASALI